MTERMPPPVEDRYEHWSEPPPVLSPRCLWWLEQLNGRRWTIAELNAELPEMIHGYDTSAELYGVWIWEWCNVLWHVVANVRWWAARDAKNPPLDEMLPTLVKGESFGGPDRTIFHTGGSTFEIKGRLSDATNTEEAP